MLGRWRLSRVQHVNLLLMVNGTVVDALDETAMILIVWLILVLSD